MNPTLTYLDFETTDFDPRKGKIVTIQSHPLMAEISPITIRREWDHADGERGIVTDFVKATNYWSKWQTIPCGFNLGFEHRWLFERSVRYGILPWDASYLDYEKPCIDLHHFAILANADAKAPKDAKPWDPPPMFKNTRLSDFSAKLGSGANIGKFYANKQYDLILDYVIQEEVAFRSLFETLVKTVPGFWRTTVAPQIGVIP